MPSSTSLELVAFNDADWGGYVMIENARVPTTFSLVIVLFCGNMLSKRWFLSLPLYQSIVLFPLLPQNYLWF